jgi:hypothetical protein
MQLFDPWRGTAGVLGIIIANLLLASVRAFAQRTGLQVHWLSRSYAPERRHLKKLVSSADDWTAKRARRYLRIEILGWTTGVLSVFLFLWGMLKR